MILCTNELLSELWDNTLDWFHPVGDHERFLAMPRPYQVFYLLFWWDCECQNGGLGHFILGHSGNLYGETIQALIEIGAHRSARKLLLMQEACGVAFSADREQRHQQLGDFEIADLDRIAVTTFQRTVAELGDWEQEEDEMKLLSYVVQHGLVENDADESGVC
jgi:hypothetical protein